MELGATVCVPNTQPQCAACPVRACCSAYKAVQQYEAAGGNPTAAKAPSVLEYPTKVRAEVGGWVGRCTLNRVCRPWTPEGGLASLSLLLYCTSHCRWHLKWPGCRSLSGL